MSSYRSSNRLTQRSSAVSSDTPSEIVHEVELAELYPHDVHHATKNSAEKPGPSENNNSSFRTVIKTLCFVLSTVVVLHVFPSGTVNMEQLEKSGLKISNGSKVVDAKAKNKLKSIHESDTPTHEPETPTHEPEHNLGGNKKSTPKAVVATKSSKTSPSDVTLGAPVTTLGAAAADGSSCVQITFEVNKYKTKETYSKPGDDYNMCDSAHWLVDKDPYHGDFPVSGLNVKNNCGDAVDVTLFAEEYCTGGFLYASWGGNNPGTDNVFRIQAGQEGYYDFTNGGKDPNGQSMISFRISPTNGNQQPQDYGYHGIGMKLIFFPEENGGPNPYGMKNTPGDEYKGQVEWPAAGKSIFPTASENYKMAGTNIELNHTSYPQTESSDDRIWCMPLPAAGSGNVAPIVNATNGHNCNCTDQKSCPDQWGSSVFNPSLYPGRDVPTRQSAGCDAGDDWEHSVGGVDFAGDVKTPISFWDYRFSSVFVGIYFSSHGGDAKYWQQCDNNTAGQPADVCNNLDTHNYKVEFRAWKSDAKFPNGPPIPPTKNVDWNDEVGFAMKQTDLASLCAGNGRGTQRGMLVNVSGMLWCKDQATYRAGNCTPYGENFIWSAYMAVGIINY